MKGLITWVNDRFPLIKTWNEHFSEYYALKILIFFIFSAHWQLLS